MRWVGFYRPRLSIPKEHKLIAGRSPGRYDAANFPSRRPTMLSRREFLAASSLALVPRAAAAEEPRSKFLDLSLLVAPEYPCTWPTFPVFQINHYQRIGPRGPYN